MPSQIRYAAPVQRSNSNRYTAWASTQSRPVAIATRRTAFPLDVQATVTNAARMPFVAPVEITRVTIGPGVRIRMTVIARNPANRDQFIHFLPRQATRCLGIIWARPIELP